VKKYFGFVFLVLSVIVSNVALAVDLQSCQTAKKKTHIYFGNGVNNTLAEANFSNKRGQVQIRHQIGKHSCYSKFL